MKPVKIVIRLAGEPDLQAIADIYNHEVTSSTATFDTRPVDLEERRGWLESHDFRIHPVIVAEVDGGIAGWAASSRWSDRCAYARAAEVSVYVQQAHRGRGIGKALLLDLIDRARSAGLGVLLARISAGEPGASMRLHESVGFQHIGSMRRVGEKFGRILDVELLEYHLDQQPGDSSPETPA
jgi:phosphinothricin acetyltransferase